MEASPVSIIVSIVVLAVIALLMIVVFRKRPAQRFSPLAALAFAFIVAGVIFGETVSLATP